MPIKVTEALDSDTSELVVLEDINRGEYVDGIFQEGSKKVKRKALASVQQPTPQELKFVTGGERNKVLLSFYLNKEVYTPKSETGRSATVIIYKSIRYKVVFVGDWSSYGYFFAIGAKEK